MTELSRDHLCHAFGLYFDLATGAGEEEVMGATAATIANALFDATGVRLRQYPIGLFT